MNNIQVDLFLISRPRSKWKDILPWRAKESAYGRGVPANIFLPPLTRPIYSYIKNIFCVCPQILWTSWMFWPPGLIVMKFSSAKKALLRCPKLLCIFRLSTMYENTLVARKGFRYNKSHLVFRKKKQSASWDGNCGHNRDVLESYSVQTNDTSIQKVPPASVTGCEQWPPNTSIFFYKFESANSKQFRCYHRFKKNQFANLKNIVTSSRPHLKHMLELK